MIFIYILAKKTYIFRSFWDRDDCYLLLKDLRSKCQIIETDSEYSLGHLAKIFIIDESPKDPSLTENINNTSVTDVMIDNQSENESSDSGLLHFYCFYCSLVDCKLNLMFLFL